MKIKLLVAAAATVVASSAMAQSAFQGFYGQIATGYESNSASGLNSPLTATNGIESQSFGSLSASNQNFGGVPLIVGLGYNFSVAPKWLIGAGVDYSLLTQESSSYSYNLNGLGASNLALPGAKIKVSNRLNIFITPGYAIDEDKLVYLKAGYSSVKVDASAPTQITNGSESAQLSQLGFNSSGQSKTLNGYVLGLGYKQIISGGFYGFAEGNYMSYSNQNFGKTTPLGSGVSLNTSTNSGINSYQLLVGVGYKF